MGNSDEDNVPDIDSLFNIEPQETVKSEQINALFIGTQVIYEKLSDILNSIQTINFIHVNSIDDAIDLLLRDIFAIVIIEDETPDIDVVTVSRIIQVNHPLARIVVVSRTRRSLKIADFINHGSVDAFIPKPLDPKQVISMITEQQAKHDIERMLTNFVSSPPKLSTASYLLLDPTLSYNEDEPVKFVGIMIAYNTVPRYSRFFEDLLAKDEILFAGYLSGISMLGREMLDSKEPLKEINFGGVSVIFRFHEDIQFSIFVRNISKHNFQDAESTITEVINTILLGTENYLASRDRVPRAIHEQIHKITDLFTETNAKARYKKELEKKKTSFDGQLILYYGTDLDEGEKVKAYLQRDFPCNVAITNSHDEANRLLKHPNCSVLILDSNIETIDDVQHPLDFADFARDEIPYLRVVYLMRDRRASEPIINSLNRGAINYLLPYRITRKELSDWIHRALEKVIEIRAQTTTVDGVSGSLDGAEIAKSMIRANEASYLTEEKPILDGIIISKDENPVFQIFWSDRSRISFDDTMIAGIVASLESVSGEMFFDDSTIGGFELGNANIMVQHRAEFNIAFFIENVNSQNALLINQDLPKYADRLYGVIQDNQESLKSDITAARFDTISNNIFSDFTEKYTEILE